MRGMCNVSRIVEHRTSAMTRTLFLSAVLLLAVPMLRAQQTDFAPTLQPDRSYTFTIKKSHSGNDGFKDIIPQGSEQTIVIETGPANPAGLAATMRIERPESVEKRKAAGAPTREWLFSFRVRDDGALVDITSESSDGEVPESLNRTVLSSQLRQLLFLPRLQLGPAASAQPIIVSQRAAADGAVTITYEMTQAQAESAPDGSPATIVTQGGTAVYSTAEKFFTQRSHIETSKMFMPADPASGEQRVVTMVVTTNYSVRISGK